MNKNPTCPKRKAAEVVKNGIANISKQIANYLSRENIGRRRHWFARFRRKSIVVSKSKGMADLTMALFARFHVNGNRNDILSLST